jgi:hypothetical protein
MREDGLTCSETMLETDTKAFLKFFNKIKESTQEATKKLEETRKTKNDKAAELRSINDEIQILVSNISKNIESLEVYNNYKVFLDQLSADNASKEEKEEMDKLAHTKTLKKEKKERLAKEGANRKGGKGKRGESREKSVSNIIEADLNIPPELKDIVEDSDDDFQLRFGNISELMDIFSTLEENNLLEI